MATGAVHLSASKGSGYMQFGELLIQWGYHNFSDVPSQRDTTAHVDFAKAYKANPSVVVSCGNWVAIRGVWSSSVSTSGFNCGVYHTQGSNASFPLNWVAIGQAAS